MDIKQLRYFVTVVKQGGFSGAAAKLHVSQPSLSKSIQNMERQIGFRLLERSTKYIRLTESGEIIYKRALTILAEMAIMEEEVKEVKIAGSGEVRLGMIESVKNWIPSVLNWYQQAYPGMHVVLKEVLGRKDVKQALREYSVHACLTNQAIEEADIVSVPLYIEKHAVVMHINHPLASKENITFLDLEGEPFIITSKGLQTRHNIIQAFETANTSMNIQYEADRFETILTLVEAGLGISIIPENYLVNRNQTTYIHKTIPSEELNRTVYLTYLKNRYMTPAISELIEHMIKDTGGSKKNE